MSEYTVDLLDDVDDRFSLHGYSVPSSKIHVNDMEEEEGNLIRKTVAMMPHISSIIPHSTDKSLLGRVTLGSPVASVENERVPPPTLPQIESQLENGLERLIEINEQMNSANPPEPAALDFPNLAWEAIKAGLLKEEITNRQIDKHIKEAEKNQKDIDLLLDFSAELAAHKEDTNEASEKLKELLAQLKERGIDLWKGEDKTLNKEKISELKSLSSAQVDQLRSKLQILFTTKIQVLIQAIGAIMDVLKDIIRNNTKLINAANRLPGR